MSHYYLADAGGDRTLWHGKADDLLPTAVAARFECSDELWTLLLRGAGLDPETVCVSREDLAHIVSMARSHELFPDMWNRLNDALRGQR